MLCMGVDQSFNNTGIVVTDAVGNVVEFTTFKSSKAMDVYDRARQVAQFVIDKIKQHRVVQMNIEGLAFGIRGDATRDLAGLLFTIITSMRNAGITIPVVIVAPTSLKKFATGSGKSDKAAMIAVVPDLFMQAIKSAGYKKTTGMTDIVDAYFLSLYKPS